jgi:ribonuclease BN (tRNA processing enzyme)
MRITVLGASGGIGPQARTTALRVDSDILIDAGTGVGDLSLEAMRAIDHVFLTHSHLDHVAALPFMLDTVGAQRGRPVTVYAQAATAEALKAHVFNDVIWPDFGRIPSPERPFMRWQVVPVGGEVTLGGRRLRSVAVNHVVPAVGYLVSGSGGSVAFSGDTTTTEEFWSVLNACPDLRHVIIETSFLDAEEDIARVSRHLCPRLLAGELAKLKSAAQVHVTHLMPGEEEEIMREIAARLPHGPRRLMRGEVIEI